MPTVPVYIKQKVYEWLLKKAREKGIGVSEAVRLIVEAEYAKERIRAA